MSAFLNLLNELKDAANDVGGGSYFVKRGAVDWVSFDFNVHPKVIAIQVDELALYADMVGTPTKISLEMATVMPGNINEIDDVSLDRLASDAKYIFSRLCSAKASNGDPIVLKKDSRSATIIEWHDVEARVQGIVVSIDLEF